MNEKEKAKLAWFFVFVAFFITNAFLYTTTDNIIFGIFSICSMVVMIMILTTISPEDFK